MARVEAMQAIGVQHAQALRDRAGVTSMATLLKAGSRPEGRQRLAELTGISLDLILRWVHLADLLRVKGIGIEYSGVLIVVGVDRLEKLQQENPENLFQNLQFVNKSRRMVRRLPTVEVVADWIEQAKELPPLVDC